MFAFRSRLGSTTVGAAQRSAPQLLVRPQAGFDLPFAAIRLTAGFAAEAVTADRKGSAGNMPRNGVRLDTDGRPLIVGNGPGVPEKVQAIVKRRYREIPTHDDGACGIHALVGKGRSGRLRHPDPRGFLRRTLGEAAGEVRLNCRNPKALDDAMNYAWKQVIKPQAQKHAHLTDRNLGMLAE